MTPNELLSRARDLGIRLWVEGGRLRYDAPAGALSDDLRRQFGEHRDEIVRRLGTAANDAMPPLAPTDRTGAIPLSFAQQRLWLLEQLEPGTSIYHTYGAVRILGALEVAALERSLTEVVRRHEALRTTFAVVDGVPGQRIAPPQPVSMIIEDLQHLPLEARAGEAQRRADHHRQTPFDLTTGPLIRVYLLRLDELEHVLVVVMHHIVCDGWSVAVITRELTLMYEAFVAGRPSPLPELPIQYGDFSVWQRAALQGERLAAQLKFWQGQLGGAAVLELPTKPRPLTASGQGAEESLMLSPPQEAALESLSRREGVTLFMTLLAAFNVLLARYARQTDIVVGVPVANRTQPQLEPLVGFFVNMLVMRSDLSGNPTFRQLLARVRTMALDAYAHQDTPFERIVEELQPDRESGRTPLFQVTFAFQNTPAASLQFGGARLEPMRIANPTTRFDLELHIGKMNGGLVARLNYSTELFEAAAMQAMLRAFGVLLDAIVADPDATISRLPLIAAADRRSLLEESGDGRALPPMTGTVASHFEQQVARTPDAVAVVFNDESLTYAALDDRANRLARHLEAGGVRTGSLVGVALDRSLDLIVALVAVLKAGAAYVPLDPSYPADRLSFIIDDAALRVVVTTATLREELPAATATRFISVDQEAAAIAAYAAVTVPSAAGPDDLAYVTYTSGSTGVPKGVEVRQRGVLRLLADQNYAHLGEDERILQLAPVPFDASTFEIWGALLYGGQCILFPDRLPVMATLEATMVRHGITTLWLTASLFNEVIDKAPGALRQVRHVLTGGEALSVPHVRRALAALPDTAITNGYGPTECTTFTCCGAIERELPERLGSLPIGRPIARTQVYLLDDEHNLVPDGMTGELYVGGDGLARGYLRRPDLTAERFVPDPFSGLPGSRLYRTGDLARRLADGRIDYLGRVDRQIKIRGFRVELGEIEAAVLAHAAIRECAVELRQEGVDKQLVAYVVPHREEPGLADALTVHLRARLPSYMVPAYIVMLERLPLTANGKIDRRLLPAPQPNRQEREVIEPRTALEATIATIWREVLGVDAVGIRDNFFDLGGHSLLLIRVHGLLTDSLKRSVPVVDLFRHPTIESLARELGGETLETRPVEHARARIARRSAAGGPNEAIAVIGMAGRFPGAASVDAFWANLRQGVESIRVFTDDELAAAGVAEELINNPRYVRARGVLDGAEMFDAGFFGYTPREAEVMDPQHRVFLECAWEALERSGYDPARYDGLIGVFAGANLNTYAANLLSNRDALAAVGGVQSLISIAGDFLPTRVSYKLNLRGPSVNIQTACSTSLVAVQTACRSLSAHDCDIALAGGVSITVPSIRGHMFQEGGIASPDGHTRAFDRASQGTVPGNGAGIVVLKRLADALADGDDIQAVIRGAAVNNDGSLKVGFTAPGVDGQADVVAMAQAAAGVEPTSITYIEAHGTGTALGDPIEVSALTRVFGQGQPNSCAIGSLKTNVGHLDSAAGVAGLIKTVMALKHRELPPSLHFEEPNPKIDFASGPFYVNARLQPWTSLGGPRRAGVSSFGIGGTNAHVVLEEAPPVPQAVAVAGAQLLVLSARSRAALDAMTANLSTFLQDTPAVSLAGVAFTLQAGRAELAHRRAVVVSDAADAIGKLSAGGSRDVSTVAAETAARSTVFMFSGQGSQYPGMAASLYEREPVFRAELDACAEVLRPYLDADIREVICNPGAEAASLLDETRITQPALFVVEYALARLLMHWGVTPGAMIGHSIGEYVAACLSGVIAREDALRLVAVRGRLMQEMPRGAMLAVALSEGDVAPLLTEGLWLAAVNATGMSVVSGTEAAVAALETALAARSVAAVRLRTSHAFHSGMMDGVLPVFAAEVRRTALKPPAIPYISNVTGTAITDQQATDPEYWVTHLRGTVRFADGVRELLENPQSLLIEVGPGASLASLARKEAGRGRASRVVACAADNSKDGQPLNAQSVLGAVGKIWLAGLPIDWAALHPTARPRRIALPTYPFDRQRYWIDARPDASAGKRPLRITRRADIADWFYEPGWTPAATVEAAGGASAPEGPWLVFTDDSAVSTAIVERLRAAGGSLVLARAGSDFAAHSAGDYTLAPAERGHYDSLIATILSEGGAPPRRVVHLWSLPEVTGLVSSFETAQAPGFYSLLYLTQALGAAGVTQPLDLHVVTSGLYAVATGDRPAPEKGTLLGLATVIPQEYPHVRCSCIDLAPSTRDDSGSRVVDAVVRELLSGAGAPAVAYRGGQRWIQTYQATSLPASVPSRIRPGGVYLITGGTGGVGLAVARRLAAAGGVKLALVSRTPAPARETWAELEPTADARVRALIGAIQAIEAGGSEALVVEADVADAGQMQKAFEAVVARFGRVDGVIHAAGVARGPGFGAIQTLSTAECEQQFRPKVHGLLVLEQMAAQFHPEFCLLTSSLSTVLGGLGYAAYAAANCFMNAFAESRRGAAAGQTSWLSVDFDGWDFAAAEGTVSTALAMTAGEGAEALIRALGRGDGTARVVVSVGDLHARIERYVHKPAAGERPGAGAPVTLSAHARPDIGSAYVPPADDIERTIAETWQELLGIAQVGREDNFFDLGGHSLLLVQVHGKLQAALGRTFPVTALFQSPTVSSLAALLVEQGAVPPARRALETHAGTADRGAVRDRSIAVVAVACRFPGAPDPEAFWQNLRNGVESIRVFSDEELRASGIDQRWLDHPQYVKSASILDEVDQFDASFFGYTPREADMTDPQHRLFLECAWEVLERAGCDPKRFAGAIGVYAGSSSNAYMSHVLSHPELAAMGALQAAIGSKSDFLPTRVSYKLNLKGPSVNVQTSCSTSLVAVHEACRSLLSGDCDLALAGGASISVPVVAGYFHQEGSITSPDGHCRAFDSRAQGTVAGSGVGIVALKRLADAQASNDTILAVIRSTATNNDGSLKVGFTAPSVEGQADVIALAQAASGVEPASISFVEAHGTGTLLGDPIEVAALARVFGRGPEKHCALASLKTNVGHLDAAAGIAGLIKTVLALRHREIPPSLNFEQPNPEIDFDNSPFYVNTSLKPWKRTAGPRRAGVSSFGIGGTNAHAILEEAPPELPQRASHRSRHLIVASARTERALDQMAQRLAAHFEAHPDVDLGDAAFTLQVGRQEFKYRRAVVCHDREEAIEALTGRGTHRGVTGLSGTKPRRIVFMFPGQGSQYPDMGRELYEREPVFRNVVDECATLLQQPLGLDLREALFPATRDLSAAAQRLQQTAIAQPVLFVTCYALARLWMSWGVSPRAMIGHSIGEYVAACLAGVFSLGDALTLIAARGQLMQSVAPGAMLAVECGADEAQALTGDGLWLAAVNGPGLCVISGDTARIDLLESRLKSDGVGARRLHTSHAFHSGMLDGIVEPFRKLVAAVTLSEPRLPFVSNVSGEWITAAQATSPAYWARHLREPVQFSKGLAGLLEDPDDALLEVGPGRTLASLAKMQPGCRAERTVAGSMRHPDRLESDQAFVLASLGRLWTAGVNVDWAGFHGDAGPRRITLPTYPFERQRHWVVARPQVMRVAPISRVENVADWFYVPSWKRSLIPSAPDTGGSVPQRCLVFMDEGGLGARLVPQLRSAGHDVTVVRAAAAFRRVTTDEYAIDPGRPQDYAALLNDLASRQLLPQLVAHLLTVAPHEETPAPSQADHWQARGFYSLLFLAQALADQAAVTSLRLVVLTSGVHEVTGAEPLTPAKATVLGPCLTIPRELSQISCRHIDLVAGEWVDAPEQALAALSDEVMGSSAEVVVAHRAGRRWVQTIERAPQPPLSPRLPQLLRREGVYLVTGGTGGIGLTLARQLTLSLNARVVLTSRNGLPPRDSWTAYVAQHGEQDRLSRQIRAVEALDPTGERVLVLAADVANDQAMRMVVDRTLEKFARLDGVIHTAGIAGGGMIQLKDPAVAARVLRPKVHGTIAVCQAVSGMPLDFIALCSSLASVIGSAGQVDYCAANAFLDAFAPAHTAQTGIPTIAINWDGWQDVGMAVETALPEAMARQRAEMLKFAIAPSDGVDAFQRIMANGRLTQIIVSPKPLVAPPAESEEMEAAPAPAAEPVKVTPDEPKEGHGRPDLSTPYVAPEAPTEVALCAIWQDLLGVQRLGVLDDFFELGGHSLLASRVTARVRETCHVNLPLRALFEAPTVRELAERVAAMQWAEQRGPAPADAPEKEQEEIDI